MKKGWIIALGAIGTGVIIYGARQIWHLYNSSLKLLYVDLKSISLSNIHLILNMELDNQGDVSAIITQQHFQVTMNDIPVSTIDIQGGTLHINSNGKTIIPIDINFNPSSLLLSGLQNLTSLLSDKSKIIIKIKGDFSLKAGIVSLKKYPVVIMYNLQELLDSKKK